jgi:hypothetical protein
MDAEKSVSGKLGHAHSEVKGGADSAVHIGHIGGMSCGVSPCSHLALSTLETVRSRGDLGGQLEHLGMNALFLCTYPKPE